MLELFGVPLPYFNFPTILVLLLINVPLSITIYGVYFFMYPIITIDK
jgi:hypothetical protein